MVSTHLQASGVRVDDRSLPGPGTSLAGATVDSGHRHLTVSHPVRPTLLWTPEQARPDIEHIVGPSDVVKVSDEDLAWLHPGRPEEEVAPSWLRRGPALVLATVAAVAAVALSLSQQRVR